MHLLMIVVGIFICVAGTYGVIMEIKQAYATGLIGKPEPLFCLHATR